MKRSKHNCVINPIRLILVSNDRREYQVSVMHGRNKTQKCRIHKFNERIFCY